MSIQALDPMRKYVNSTENHPDLTLLMSAYECQGPVDLDLTDATCLADLIHGVRPIVTISRQEM